MHPQHLRRLRDCDLPLGFILGIPRASVPHRTSTLTLALAYPSQLFWEVLLVDLHEQNFLLVAATNVDLGRCNLVQPGLNSRPYHTEAPRSIDDIELAHAFGVTVLADGCCLHHVVLNLEEVGKRDALKIEDRAGRFHGVTNCLGAGRETLVNEFLIFVHQSLELTFWSGDSVELLDVEETQPLDIYWSTILDTPNPVRSNCQSVD